MFGRSGKPLPLSGGSRRRALLVEADPLLGELVRLPFHSRLLDGEVLGERYTDAVQEPEQGPLVVLDQVLVDHRERLRAAVVEEFLPGGVVLVDAQLEVVYRGEAEAQPLPADVLVGVPAPLLGLERLPQRDRLAGGVPASDPDEQPQVRQYRPRHVTGTHILQPPRPAREADEVAEVGPHDLGSQHTVLGCSLPKRILQQRLEIGRTPGGVPARRMLGVPATVLAEDVPKLGVVQQRPYLWIVGALEVVARLPRLPSLKQHLEVLCRAARNPRALEGVTQQRAPAARRRADEVRHLRNRHARSSYPNACLSHLPSPLI